MSRSSSTLLLLLLLSLLTTGSPGQQRIVPLGDSITESFAGRAGYRFFLWKRLDQAKACVDFVGGRHGVAQGQPLFDDFDQDHSGFSGFPAIWVDQRMQLMPSSVPTADIALVHLGTNDILLPLLLGLTPDLDTSVRALTNIVVALRARNPAVKIAVAKILPIDPNLASLPTAHLYVPVWNDQYLPRILHLSTAASPIVLVDMNTGIKPSVHLVDGVHPNDVGASELADRWFAALDAAQWLPAPTRCVTTLSPGCTKGARIQSPHLSVQNPAVGGTMTVQLKGLPDEANAIAVVFGTSEAAPPMAWAGCPLHPSLDVIFYSWSPTRQPASSLTFTMNVPNLTPPGLEVYAQSIVCTMTPGAGATSNGLQVVLY